MLMKWVEGKEDEEVLYRVVNKKREVAEETGMVKISRTMWMCSKGNLRAEERYREEEEATVGKDGEINGEIQKWWKKSS